MLKRGNCDLSYVLDHRRQKNTPLSPRDFTLCIYYRQRAKRGKQYTANTKRLQHNVSITTRANKAKTTPASPKNFRQSKADHKFIPSKPKDF